MMLLAFVFVALELKRTGIQRKDADCIISTLMSLQTRPEKKERTTTQAAKHSLHQLRKRRHIGPKCR
jgi:hypothetical protein